MALSRSRVQKFLVIFVISIVIAVILGISSSDPHASQELFVVSSILLWIWIIFTYYFFMKISRLREIHADHNRVTLILGSTLIAILYLFFGQYTTILNSTIESDGFTLITIWEMIFGLFYALYSLIQLRNCFTKYFSVYMGLKSIDARRFGIMTLIIAFVFEIMLASFLIQYQPQTNYGNIQISSLFYTLFLVIYFVYYGFILKSVSAADISTDRISSQLDRISRRADQNAARARASERRAIEARRREEARKKERERQRRERERQRRESERQRARELERQRERERDRSRAKQRELDRRREAERRKKQAQRTKSQTQRPKTYSTASSRSGKSKNKNISMYKRLRPKGNNLSEEDFKCIFCFQDIKPNDKNHTGVVLCPVCKYPAHLDEFLDWTYNSPLCSRCDSPIPTNYRKHPKVVSLKDYAEARDFWLKYEKKKKK